MLKSRTYKTLTHLSAIDLTLQAYTAISLTSNPDSYIRCEL